MNSRRFLKGAAALAPLLLLGAAPPSPPPAPRYGQIVVHEQIYVRVTTGPSTAPPLVRWKEGKGPKCVPARLVAGYAIVAPASVDFFLRDNRRIRARLDSSCPALDYYRGFYVTPNPDGQICADRDVIRSRMGGECGIDKFRTLKARR
ncbi:MAG TPA: hypothetical protein VH331_16930 [Allosphingosinicella sp.]|jgi:hypothetical protein|nr:hypothetical protein [Allosphingosinicella sp.]